jgi:hypothetical protein
MRKSVYKADTLRGILDVLMCEALGEGAQPRLAFGGPANFHDALSSLDVTNVVNE